MNEIIKPRGSLSCLKKAIKAGKVRMGFMGGSITGAHREANWPYFVNGWFVRKFPGVRYVWENAAIGGSGSLSGLMRAQRDLIDTRCDIVFVEYAVNDAPGEETMRSREGLVRKLLEEKRDLVFVYTYDQGMYADMSEGRMPQSIVELELLAERYNLPSVWMGLHAYNEVKAGRMSWEAWLPEGLHPEYMGSGVYAEPLLAYLTEELEAPDQTAIPHGRALPAPHNPNNFQDIYEIPFDVIDVRGGPWSEMREVMLPWYRMVLSTAADGAGLSFRFTGRALCVMLNFGKMSAVLKYRFDGGEWREFVGGRGWMPDKNLCHPALLADDLGGGEHLFELKVTHGNREECKGTNCKIFSFMAVK